MKKQVGITNSSYNIKSTHTKVGRNDPCPCGSGKKYKKCCLNSVSPPSQVYDELDSLMTRGQLLLEKNKTAEACDVWLELWTNLKGRFKPEFRNIKEAELIFSGSDYIYNWCQDLEAELGNAGIGNLKYYKKRLEYCSEFCSIFPESDKMLMGNMKRAIAESHFAIGNKVKGNKCFTELIEQYPDRIWGYIGWGDMYFSPLQKDIKPNYDKAEQIYKMGLGRNIKEEAVLIDRLDKLREERNAGSS
ncbi:MAG: SEC-C domain-containing protein [Spirochaetales bacterium]|nr:SEC-C domain-containing protein [Spirochaetales bacterium]